MIKTVVIVGAGASKSFDPTGTMPVGSELAEQIERLMDEELLTRHSTDFGPIAGSFSRNGGVDGSHYAAMARIRDSIHSKNSIDDFISEWSDVPHLEAIAKRAIAICILAGESASQLMDLDVLEQDGGFAGRMRSMRPTWLATIARSINPEARRRDFDQVFQGLTFITFNYDRCIEQYLYAYATRSLNVPPPEAAALVSRVPIHHVYGSLGPLPFARGTLGFGDPNHLLIEYAAANIRTYSEETTPGVRLIQERVHGAENVILLGLGFHPQNLKIIAGESWEGSGRIWATAKGLTQRRNAEVSAYFHANTIGRPASRFADVSADGLLQTYGDEIFGG